MNYRKRLCSRITQHYRILINPHAAEVELEMIILCVNMVKAPLKPEQLVRDEIDDAEEYLNLSIKRIEDYITTVEEAIATLEDMDISVLKYLRRKTQVGFNDILTQLHSEKQRKSLVRSIITNS